MCMLTVGVDLKIDLALAEVMKRYKRLIRRTSANFGFMGATLTQKLSTKYLVRSIVNCFGLPTINADVAIEALKASVWKTLGANFQLAAAELLSLIGLTGTVFAAGIPVWLISGSINASHIVPTTCRLFLIMACDLTLVLARSFREVTFRSRGQPSEKDVSAAARNYALRGYAQHVHRDIKALIPRKNVIACFKAELIHRKVEDIFATYKDKLLEDTSLPLQVDGLTIRSESDTDTNSDADLFNDYKEARKALAELESKQSLASQPGVPELDGSTLLAELSAEREMAELSGVSSISKRTELEGSTGFDRASIT